MTLKVKWQGQNQKRASHAFLIDATTGNVSLCGAEPLTSNGETSDVPSKLARNACGRCVNKIKKLNSTE